MRVPVWLTLVVAILVLFFGAYRIRISLRSDEEDERARARKGLYALRRRTHFLIGVIYLLLGGALVATTFGWNPLGGLLGPPTEPPRKDAAPAKAGTIPIDHLPTPSSTRPGPSPAKPATEPAKPGADPAKPVPDPANPAPPAK